MQYMCTHLEYFYITLQCSKLYNMGENLEQGVHKAAGPYVH